VAEGRAFRLWDGPKGRAKPPSHRTFRYLKGKKEPKRRSQREGREKGKTPIRFLLELGCPFHQPRIREKGVGIKTKAASINLKPYFPESPSRTRGGLKER